MTTAAGAWSAPGNPRHRRICDRLPEASAPWNGIIAPKNTPDEIVKKLNSTINAVVADPKIKTHLISLGVVPMSMTPSEFGKLIANET